MNPANVIISVRLSSFAHATEDLDKVVQAILNVCPRDLTEKVHTDVARGHYGNKIVACRLTISGSSKAERVFKYLWENISDSDKEQLYKSADAQTDESGTLHIRVDKQESLRGRILLRDDEPVKVEIKFKGWNQSRPVEEAVKARISTGL